MNAFCKKRKTVKKFTIEMIELCINGVSETRALEELLAAAEAVNKTDEIFTA
jgi:hypothetical protein